MKKHNPTISEQQLHSYKASGTPLKFTKVTISNGSNFFNTYRGSKIEVLVSLPFNVTDTVHTSIIDVKSKTTGSYTVSGCLKWLDDSEKVIVNRNVEKRIRSAVLFDGTDHIRLTMWEDLLDQEFTEFTNWYTFTEVTLKDYFGLKLSTSTFTRLLPSDKTEALDWSIIDLNQYNEEESSEKETILCCPEILCADATLFPTCSSKTCGRKVSIVPGARLVQCDHCSRKMKPTSCIMKLECVVEFDELKVNLPIDVLTKFFGEETIQSLKNGDELIEKLLYLDSIDYSYNHRNIITKMENH